MYDNVSRSLPSLSSTSFFADSMALVLYRFIELRNGEVVSFRDVVTLLYILNPSARPHELATNLRILGGFREMLEYER